MEMGEVGDLERRPAQPPSAFPFLLQVSPSWGQLLSLDCPQLPSCPQTLRCRSPRAHSCSSLPSSSGKDRHPEDPPISSSYPVSFLLRRVESGCIQDSLAALLAGLWRHGEGDAGRGLCGVLTHRVPCSEEEADLAQTQPGADA